MDKRSNAWSICINNGIVMKIPFGAILIAVWKAPVRLPVLIERALLINIRLRKNVFFIFAHAVAETTLYVSQPYARDTRYDKMSNATSWMENRTVCHAIRFLSYEVEWSWMESVQT